MICSANPPRTVRNSVPLDVNGNEHWTRGQTGKRVRISGYELWQLDEHGLIRDSKGHFDAAEFERQVMYGVVD